MCTVGRARHGSIGRDPSIDMSTQVRDDALSSQRKPTPFVAEMVEFAPKLLKSVDNYTSDAMIHIPVARLANGVVLSSVHFLCSSRTSSRPRMV